MHRRAAGRLACPRTQQARCPGRHPCGTKVPKNFRASPSSVKTGIQETLKIQGDRLEEEGDRYVPLIIFFPLDSRT